MTFQAAAEHTPSGLRERNKAKRREAIVVSALELLRVTPIAEVSIERIAARAEVSPATVYNLMGTRDQLLLACVDRVVEQVRDALLRIDPAEDPIAAASAVVELSSEAFIAERDAFRQIVRTVNGISRSGGMTLALDPAQLQIAAMRSAQEHGLLRDDIDPIAVGRQIYLSYNGALFAWAAGQLSDDGFRSAVRHGLWSALAAFGGDQHRPDFLKRLRETGSHLVDAGYGNG